MALKGMKAGLGPYLAPVMKEQAWLASSLTNVAHGAMVIHLPQGETVKGLQTKGRVLGSLVCEL